MPSREIQKIITAMSNEDVKFLGSQSTVAVWYKLINSQAFCLGNSVLRSELIKEVFPNGEYKEALDRLKKANPRQDKDGNQSAEYLNAEKAMRRLNARFGSCISQIRDRVFPIFNAWLLDHAPSIGEEREYCFALCKDSINLALEKDERKSGRITSRTKIFKALLKAV